MADVVVFHHVQGLTAGVEALAERLREAGHQVWTPDALDGRTFETIEDGMAYTRRVGFGAVAERFVAAAGEHAPEVVYVGISLGVMAAQQLAQTRPGALGAVFISGCLPPSEFGRDWPEDVPLQIHGKADDEFFAEDLAAAEALVADTEAAELFTYPGSQHLFVDSSLGDYDETAAADVEHRILALLAGI